MKNLFQVYHQLKMSKSSLVALAASPEKNYSERVQPKMKFGRPQQNENYCKLRHIVAPKRELKLIQKKICKDLQKIDLPGCMYGSVRTKNNVQNALQHVENKFFLTIDLKNFFTRINNQQIHKVFLENGYCWEAARILTKLTSYKYLLPQGAPTSPVLANLAFKETVLQLDGIAKNHNLIFTTYLDDLTFSSKKDFKHLQTQILEKIKANHFFPNPEKVHYYEGMCEVTGLFVGNGELKMEKQMLEEAGANEEVRKYVEYVHKCYCEYKFNKNSSLHANKPNLQTE